MEKLPYYAYMLKKNTKKIKETPAADCELFVFAENPDWKDELDPTLLLAVENLINEYEAVLSRIRSCRAPIKNKAKQTDIERILYSRGQEDQYDTDTLYALFSEMDFERIADIRIQLTEKKWHLMDKTERLDFLSDYLPEAEEYFGLFSDFRFGGYRILGDLICDIEDENNAEERKKLHRDTDSDVFAGLMKAYEEKSSGISARDAVSAVCRKLIKEILNPRMAVRYLVALGKRNLLWDVVPDAVEKEVKRYAE